MDPLDDGKVCKILRTREANAAFWKWVTGRKAHNNPRGDFIRDTRNLVEAGIEPGSRILGASTEAKTEYWRLLREFARSESGMSEERTTTDRMGFGFAIVMVDSHWRGGEFGVVVCDACRPAFDVTFPSEMFVHSKENRAEEIPSRCANQLAGPHCVRCGRAPET